MRRTRASAGGELKNTEDCFICWKKTDKTGQLSQSFMFKRSKLPLLELLSEALCQEIKNSNQGFHFCKSCKTLLNDYDHGIWLVKRSQINLQKLIKEKRLRVDSNLKDSPTISVTEESVVAVKIELDSSDEDTRDELYSDEKESKVDKNYTQTPKTDVIKSEDSSESEEDDSSTDDFFKALENSDGKRPKKYHKRKKADHECNLCCAKFNSDPELKNHEALHEGLEPFKCPVCLKQLKNKISLVHHMCLHTGEMHYVCSECGRGFITDKSLSTHRLTHTQIKAHKCHICSKAFTTVSHLNRHIKLHTSSEKPWKCRFCGKGFAQKYNTVVHEKTVHEGVKRERKKKPFPADTFFE